ncbi:MAG TPA: DUF4301 family protein [Fibrobacteria bacterium]|nr:DUF4301 family protein [Fibrobacteria bacterium]
MRHPLLNDRDLAFLETRGISPEEAVRQLQLLENGVRAPVLSRAATVGDGIVRCPVEELDALLPQFDGAAGCGEVGFFVPASGAASRMFAGPAQLLAHTHPDPQAESIRLRRLAQAPVVHRNLWDKGVDPEDAEGIARLLVKDPPEGYGWAGRPKAFVPFHEDPEPSFPLRTPLVEQIAESAEILGKAGRGTVHFTLAEGWPLPAQFDETCRALGRRHGGDVVAGASLQSPSTDTLSLESDGTLVRDQDGRPALRAGGHGSLLANLSMTPGKVVLVKNIDNIQPDARRPYVVPWRRRLGALALALRTRSDRFLSGGSSQELRDLAARTGVRLPEADGELRELVDRPLRVAGMVPNVGEPGGGPFWVVGERGERLEIVEQSEIDPSQKGLISGSTHFNPVELACCLDRADGTRRSLDSFVDPSRAFLSKKPSPRGDLRVFERPGLWNGAMSGWWTVFLEIPLDTFLPAKTVHDLAHPWRLETDRA